MIFLIWEYYGWDYVAYSELDKMDQKNKNWP